MIAKSGEKWYGLAGKPVPHPNQWILAQAKFHEYRHRL
jgi:hypothetical protein